MKPTRAQLSDSDALRLVIEGTAAETGAAFFQGLVRNLAQALGTCGAWATQYLPAERKLRSLAMWMKGEFIPHCEYALAGTACERVVESRKLIHFPDRLVELFPQDTDLLPVRAVSYLGMPLLDTEGNVIGHISVLDDKLMPRDERIISLFEIFAARAAAELRRLKVEEELRAREQEMSTLLETAMDAIIVLDAQNTIVRLNPAAERLFGCTSEDLLGENLRDFLPAESSAQLDAFIKELDAQPAERRQIWIPQSFVVQRWDKSTFPAEATISRFTNRSAVLHTMILRNVDERLAAERRIELLAAEAEYLRENARDYAGMGEMLGSSAVMKALFESLQRVAATDATVLVTGETGTGKELIAQSIHDASKRKEKPLIRVNCAAIPGTLMESEFFGHERGAFTGATTKREGRFALADGGTIFLDEVGELPLDLQAKLLRVLQEGQFEPLGGTRTREVDVRVVAATNRDLGAMVAEGKFREDLFYRLNVFPVRVPGLRERGEDIALLAQAFVKRFARRMGRRIDSLATEDQRRLQAYHWPGNVRELQNVIERALILATGNRIDLQRALPSLALIPEVSAETTDGTLPRILNAAELEAIERLNLERALDAAAGKVSGSGGVAEILGLPASTVSSRMKALGIQRKS